MLQIPGKRSYSVLITVTEHKETADFRMFIARKLNKIIYFYLLYISIPQSLLHFGFLKSL